MVKTLAKKSARLLCAALLCCVLLGAVTGTARAVSSVTAQLRPDITIIIKERVAPSTTTVKSSRISAASAVSLEDAKAAALTHAGVAASDATFTKQKLDRDDGRTIYACAAEGDGFGGLVPIHVLAHQLPDSPDSRTLDFFSRNWYNNNAIKYVKEDFLMVKTLAKKSARLLCAALLCGVPCPGRGPAPNESARRGAGPFPTHRPSSPAPPG